VQKLKKEYCLTTLRMANLNFNSLIMNCLLVAATIHEIKPFLPHYRNRKSTINRNIDIDILVSGIGLTTTTYHLTKQCYIKKPDLIIQAGVAGCFDLNMTLGDVVAVKQDCIADESVVELQKLKTLFDLKLVPHNQFPYKNGWLNNNNTTLLTQSKLKAVKGISVNQISSDEKMISFYKSHFKPVVESMEGAALHYVSIAEKIPFLQIRSISNYIGERNRQKWKMKEAVVNLNKELLRLLSTL
jgi:futalosine hydrolase